MTEICNNNFFILTGAMGAGKSSVLNELRKFKLTCIDEPARQLLAEQRDINANGVPDKNPALFTQLLLSRSIYQYQQLQSHPGRVLFDRGIPDSVGYAQLFKLDTKHFFQASEQYRYNKNVFHLPGWQEIYENDDERKMTYEQANSFGESIKKCYEEIGYNVIKVPFATPQVRAQFILNKITNNE